jgi:hypothetical protein
MPMPIQHQAVFTLCLMTVTSECILPQTNWRLSVQVGDLVRRIGIGKGCIHDRHGIVVKANGDKALLFVYWGTFTTWILSRSLEVVNESR